jgi:hypothetical protein
LTHYPEARKFEARNPKNDTQFMRHVTGSTWRAYFRLLLRVKEEKKRIELSLRSAMVNKRCEVLGARRTVSQEK